MSYLTEEKLREKIEADLSAVSKDKLVIIAEFIDFIKQKDTKENKQLNSIKQVTKSSEEIRFKPASGKGFLRHAGKWEGDDLEDCVKQVYEARGKVKVNNRINPFE